MKTSLFLILAAGAVTALAFFAGVVAAGSILFSLGFGAIFLADYRRWPRAFATTAKCGTSERLGLAA